MSAKKFDIGVIVGRFQVPELHFGHRKLMELVTEETRNLLVLIGVAKALGTKENPLDFTTRARMIQTAFPNAIVLPLIDSPTNEEWSRHLELMIRTSFPMGTIALYGGRDSFAKHYKGRLKVVTVPEFSDDSGTVIRKEAGKTILNSADFRAGIIYSTQNQYPRLHKTVDIAITKNDTVLLGMKSFDGGLVFPGGFVDPSDDNLECAAIRELTEEVGNDISLAGGATDLKYVGSFLIDDWRYQNEEKLMTSLFTAEVSWGTAKPSDELKQVGFYKLNKKTREMISENHKPLFDALLKYKEGADRE